MTQDFDTTDWVILSPPQTWRALTDAQLIGPGYFIALPDRSNTACTVLLIGDINDRGGSCECCADVSDDDVVLAYKKVVDTMYGDAPIRFPGQPEPESVDWSLIANANLRGRR
jgi:hypothetical protein